MFLTYGKERKKERKKGKKERRKKKKEKSNFICWWHWDCRRSNVFALPDYAYAFTSYSIQWVHSFENINMVVTFKR